MNILAFGASTSRQSINKQLAHHATNLLTTLSQVNSELLDLNDYELPLFSEDLEKTLGEAPQQAHAFLNKIGDSDGIIISFAEHNGSYSAAYKNLFDWASRINPKVFQHKKMVLLATSPGSGGASNVLTSAVNSAPFFAGEVVASFSLPNFYENFDVNNTAITNEAIQQQFITALKKLIG